MFYKHLRQSEGTFYLLMRAKVEPSITQLQFFAKAFGVEMEALIEEPIKIRSLVEEEAMSQKEFAEKLGLSK
jgi:transcriptional regulator with XRE-family HTH domain